MADTLQFIDAETRKLIQEIDTLTTDAEQLRAATDPETAEIVVRTSVHAAREKHSVDGVLCAPEELFVNFEQQQRQKHDGETASKLVAWDNAHRVAVSKLEAEIENAKAPRSEPDRTYAALRELVIRQRLADATAADVTALYEAESDDPVTAALIEQSRHSFRLKPSADPAVDAAAAKRLADAIRTKREARVPERLRAELARLQSLRTLALSTFITEARAGRLTVATRKTHSAGIDGRRRETGPRVAARG